MSRVNEIHVRVATEKDVEKIQSIAEVTWHKTYAGVIPESNQDHIISVWYSTTGLKESLLREDSRFLVAETGGEVVGFAQFSMRPDAQAQLSRIYVLPDIQGKGAGRLLLKDGLNWLKQKQVRELRVIVGRENRIGRGFYEATGFRWLRDFDDDFQDEVISLDRLPSCEYALRIDRS